MGGSIERVIVSFGVGSSVGTPSGVGLSVGGIVPRGISLQGSLHGCAEGKNSQNQTDQLDQYYHHMGGNAPFLCLFPICVLGCKNQF